jgi:hypothetical protein
MSELTSSRSLQAIQPKRKDLVFEQTSRTRFPADAFGEPQDW